jgi:Domain of unknown function (DUF3846)
VTLTVPQLNILAVKVGQKPVVDSIGSNLESMQAFVGGYIEAVTLPPPFRHISLICHEEGKLIPLPPNRIVPGVDLVHGDFFLCGTKGEDFASLSIQDCERLERWLSGSST